MYTISVTGALESNQPPDYMETCPSTMVTAYTGASLSSLRKVYDYLTHSCYLFFSNAGSQFTRNRNLTTSKNTINAW